VSAVTLPGRTGVLIVNTATTVASLTRPEALALWWDLVEPRLFAQGGAATGTLTLTDGTTVRLSGTASGGSVQLSGPNGYSVTGSATRVSFSGMVTTPTGSGTVTALAPSAPYNEPADPRATYEGTYSMRATGYFRNTNVDTGQSQRNCGFDVEVTGTLRIDLRNSAPSPRYRFTELFDTWRETSTVASPCPSVPNFSPVVAEGSNDRGLTRDAQNIQYGFDDGPYANGDGLIRTWGFVGVLNGTAIEGRLIRSRHESLLASAISRHDQGYPPTEVIVTLRKR
jgi:hypothetical protein